MRYAFGSAPTEPSAIGGRPSDVQQILPICNGEGKSPVKTEMSGGAQISSQSGSASPAQSNPPGVNVVASFKLNVPVVPANKPPSSSIGVYLVLLEEYKWG